MYEYSATTRIDRPVAAVFAYVADVTKQPEWTHFLISCQLQDQHPIGAGAVAEQTIRMMGRTRVVELHVVEFEANRYIRFEKDEPFYVSFGFRVVPGAGGTDLTYTVAMQPRGMYRLFIPLIARRKNDKDLATIKTKIESRETIT